MVQKKKVTVMTKLAIEESHHHRLGFISDHFWTSDYILGELWKSFLVITVGFGAVIAVWLWATSDTWTYEYHLADVWNLAVRILVWYGITVMCGLLIAFIFHMLRYLEAYRRRERIRRSYRELNRMYREEDRLEAIRAGRTDPHLSRKSPGEE